MNTRREHSPHPKVFGVGLGRTGTLSLQLALEMLGFGPCHHPITVGMEAVEWGKFAKAAKVEEGASREFLDDLYRGYTSAVDNPTAMIAKSLYNAYPDAKFILAKPAKWGESMHKTLLKFVTARYYGRKSRFAAGTATEEDFVIARKLETLGLKDWIETFHENYHQNHLESDTEGEFLRHNQYIMDLIPPKKLLVFNVADGWDPLTRFLGVPKPDKPFPRVNDSGSVLTTADEWTQRLQR